MTSAQIAGVLVLFSWSQVAAQLVGTGEISGKVVDVQNGNPIPKAALTLNLEGPRPATAIAITDSEGAFRFEALPAGVYQLQAERRGYQTLAYGTRVAGAKGTYLKLAEGSKREDLIIPLPMSSLIEGNIQGSDGSPSHDIPITLYRMIHRDGKLQALQEGMVQSDAIGSFRIPVSQPGRFCLVANQSPMQSYGMVFMNSKQVMLNLPAVYPPGCGDEQGERVELAAGARRSNVNLTLVSALAGQVKGKVILADRPVGTSQIQVRFRSLSPWPLAFQFSARASSTGELMPFNLGPGSYLVSAHYENGGEKQMSFTQIEVAPGESKEINLTPQPMLQLSCQVKVEGPKPERFRQIAIRIHAESRPDLFSIRATWSEGGACLLAELPGGLMRLSFPDLPPELYVKSAQLGNRNVLDTAFELHGNPSQDLQIVLSSAGASVSGEMEKPESGDQTPATVVVARIDPPAQTTPISTKTDAEGKFRVTSLAPGAYRVYAFDQLEPEAFENGFSLQQYLDSSQLIRVKDGDQAALKLSLIRRN
ncbi:carboxypeptidase regulatory-like domain-containing protein [Bryobacter aggregatus]|uniref:carboxypeptidase regulatory-like domain-containing protein n=1 Tax=Bryobacter aggregatus TaxID=360054 RepID=UPI0004E1FBDF|nr:carboxypeptidase regulatory-like domain-containing protein [Bryobacter aggregatus]